MSEIKEKDGRTIIGADNPYTGSISFDRGTPTVPSPVIDESSLPWEKRFSPEVTQILTNFDYDPKGDPAVMGVITEIRRWENLRDAGVVEAYKEIDSLTARLKITIQESKIKREKEWNKELIFTEANMALLEEDFDHARTLFERVLNIDPKDKKALFYIKRLDAQRIA